MTTHKTLTFDGRDFVLLFDDLIPPLNDEERSALKESIRQHGVLEAVKITPDDAVIDGGNRLRLAKELGLTLSRVPLVEVPASTKTAETLAVQLNSVRRQWTAERRILVAHRLRKRGYPLS